MPLFLPPLILALLILAFIPVAIRVIHGEKTEIQIEIQPFCLILTGSEKKKSKKNEKSGQNTKDIFSIISRALPYSEVTLSKLNIAVFGDEIYSLYTNTAFLGASLYPLLCYVGLRSKKLTVKNGALDCAPAAISDKNKTVVYVNVTFDLRLYAVIRVLTHYFLLKRRRALNARRN